MKRPSSLMQGNTKDNQLFCMTFSSNDDYGNWKEVLSLA